MKRTVLIPILLLTSLVFAAVQCDSGAAPVPTKSLDAAPAQTARPGANPYPAATSEPQKPTATAAVGGYPPATASGERLLNERCMTSCHNLDRVKSAKKSSAEWQATVESMMRKGVKLNDAEKAALIAYLAATYK